MPTAFWVGMRGTSNRPAHLNPIRIQLPEPLLGAGRVHPAGLAQTETQARFRFISPPLRLPVNETDWPATQDHLFLNDAASWRAALAISQNGVIYCADT